MNVLEQKTNLIDMLEEQKKEYIKFNIEYKKKKCKLLLETDFASVLDKSRPTVDEKNAYVDLNTLKMREKKELLYNDIKTLEMYIELCNDELYFGVDIND